jgi:hypothetical protein
MLERRGTATMTGHGRRFQEARRARITFDPTLRAELVAMAGAEAQLDAQLRASGALTATQAAIDHPEYATLSARHAERIWELLDDLELWPGEQMVGADGCDAAWRIVMHAQRDLDLQRRAYDHFELAVDWGDAPPERLALLEDRIAMSEGRPQRYGTQLIPRADGSTLDPWPIEEPTGLDRRRARVGLGPFAAQLAEARSRFPNHSDPGPSGCAP